MEKLKLFACCIPVKGASKSVICDIQRGSYKHIPNSMFDFITKYESRSIEDIKKDFDVCDHANVDRYINFLLNEEFAFLTECPEYYPKIDLQWRSPTAIANAVIDYDEFSQHDFNLIFNQLQELRCLHVELRFFDIIAIDKLTEILNATDRSALKSIDLLLKYETGIKQTLTLTDLLACYKRINNVFIHSAPEAYITELNTDNNLFFTSQLITDETHCGIINRLNFSSNIGLFTESVNFNSCLNRKISVDKKGQIRNCPSMALSFGHISNTALKEVIENDDFRKIWGINKDQVHICQDCEFRYICTDCRAYLKNPADQLSKPLKCSYNPYIGEWEN